MATQGGGSAGGEDDALADGFGLTGPTSGLRSPDAIDNPRNILQITTSVGVQALPPEEMAQLQQQLALAGLTPDGFQSGTLDDHTEKALNELKAISATMGMSDMDTLRVRIEQAALAEAGMAGGASGGVHRTVSEPVFTDPLTARNIVRAAMQDRLGRAPTADEYHQFRTSLSNSEGGQDVTTQTTSTNAKGVSTTKVTRSDDTTDPSPTDLADEFTRTGKLGKEANTRTIATDYYGVVDRLIGG